MKKLSILITALLITIAASAQITGKTQLPTVTKDQRCIMIDADGKFDVYEKINNELATASEAIQGDVLIITTQCEVYNKFLADFYSQSPYSDNCVILFLDYVKNTYLITTAGNLKDYEEYYPDFTILNVSRRKTIYWEHLGMFDNPGYYDKAVRKINTYGMNDIRPGENLILTFESSGVPLNTLLVKKYIEKYCI